MNQGKGESRLARRILLSIALASIGFLTILTTLVHYANENLEYDLLENQIKDELEILRTRLQQNPDAALPNSAKLQIFLASRSPQQPLPQHLASLQPGVYHDIPINNRDYHIVVINESEDNIYLQYDITEIEQSESLLNLILLSSWVVMIALILILARALSRRLAGPVARLSEEVSQLNPNHRGIQLRQHFSDDEVGSIAAAFDLYLQRMDDYVEKQNAFTAMASHELRSPMTIVQTSADLIDCQHQDAPTQRQIEKIRRATHGMSEIIDALLQITRDQPNATENTTLNLSQVVNETLEWLQPDIRFKKIQVMNHLDQTVTINANATLVTVVCTNLIKNALKHGSESDITIEWQTPTLSIIDRGQGINNADLQHIFDFAHRGQHSQGYGIGLYVSKMICDHQGWRLQLEPEPAGGIRASVTFA